MAPALHVSLRTPHASLSDPPKDLSANLDCRNGSSFIITHLIKDNALKDRRTCSPQSREYMPLVHSEPRRCVRPINPVQTQCACPCSHPSHSSPQIELLSVNGSAVPQNRRCMKISSQLPVTSPAGDEMSPRDFPTKLCLVLRLKSGRQQSLHVIAPRVRSALRPKESTSECGCGYDSMHQKISAPRTVSCLKIPYRRHHQLPFSMTKQLTTSSFLAKRIPSPGYALVTSSVL